jgi:hypothetical protein
MQQVTIKVKKGVPRIKYSESFKKQVVREYESGAFSKKQVQIKYGIKGKSGLLKGRCEKCLFVILFVSDEKLSF